MRISTRAIFVSGLALFLFLFIVVFKNAYESNSKSVVDAWLFAETNALKEGQLLPTIAKAERLIKQSHQLSGVSLYDLTKASPVRLMSIGQEFEANSTILSRPIIDRAVWTGFGKYLILRTVPGAEDLLLVFATNLNFWMPLLLVVLALALFQGVFMAYLSRRQAADQFNLFKNSLNSLVLNSPDPEFLRNEAPQFAEIWRLTQLQIASNQNELARARAQAEVVSVATQVAHDIRSPLSALSILVKSLQGKATQEQSSLLTSAILRIEGIAKDLLKRNNGSAASPLPMSSFVGLEHIELFTLRGWIHELVKEKQILSQENNNSLEINFHSETIRPGFTKLDLITLGRVISNLLQNAIEAEPVSKVDIRMLCADRHVEVKIEDNGRGIPSNVLTSLGRSPLSFGKEDSFSGHGLGISHATYAIEKMNGSLVLASKENVGTTVTLTFPFFEQQTNS